MTEQATVPNTAVAAPTIPNITVTRNEVSVVYTQAEMKKGKQKGWKYPALEINETNLDTGIAYIGRGITAKRLSALVRSMAQGWWDDALDEATNKETGQVDMDKAVEVFTKLASEFSARGESIPELKSQIEELVGMMTDLSPEDPEFATKFQSYAKDVKDLQLAISLKRRDKKTEGAETSAE